MEKIIKIPEGVEVWVENFKVRVKGKLGEIEKNFYNRRTANILKIEKLGNEIKVGVENKKGKALLG
ncbi:MAG: hypothetical protein DRP14_01135, partial [Candidatus Aenigmatarchaeota archaeon]